MTNLSWTLYATDALHSLGELLFITGFIGMLAISVITFGMSVTNDKFETSLLKYLWLPMSCLLITCFIPLKSTMYMIMSTEYLNSTGLPTKVQQALEIKLDDYIHALKNKDKK